MHRIESEVEEVEVPADNGDGSEESEYIESQTEYINNAYLQVTVHVIQEADDSVLLERFSGTTPF